ncbi:MAG TPA: hypothetical protein VKQ27_11105 [Acetobacteraceae bacterium]|nr:hypothetical protein [Acetobacteraceae bacterium]
MANIGTLASHGPAKLTLEHPDGPTLQWALASAEVRPENITREVNLGLGFPAELEYVGQRITVSGRVIPQQHPQDGTIYTHSTTLPAPTVPRDEITAEAVAELRGILNNLRRICDRPDTLVSPRIDQIVARLLAILGLSPGERAFVQDAADANAAGRMGDLDDVLAIFADWLEDGARPEIAGRMRRLRFADGDVLILTYSPEDAEAAGAVHTAMDRIRDSLPTKVDCLAISLPESVKIEEIDAVHMRTLGWVRTAEHDALFANLQSEVKDEPECVVDLDRKHGGGLTSGNIIRLIRRLKQENAQLREVSKQKSIALLEAMGPVRGMAESLAATERASPSRKTPADLGMPDTLMGHPIIVEDDQP